MTKLTYDYQEEDCHAIWEPVWMMGAPRPRRWIPPGGPTTRSRIGWPIIRILGTSTATATTAAATSSGLPRGRRSTTRVCQAVRLQTYYAYNDFGLPTIRRDAEYNETHFLYFPESDPDGDGTDDAHAARRSHTLDRRGSAGGGYLKQKVLDATPAMPMPAGPVVGRDSGQNPTPQNISNSFTYDRVGNIKTEDRRPGNPRPITPSTP